MPPTHTQATVRVDPDICLKNPLINFHKTARTNLMIFEKRKIVQKRQSIDLIQLLNFWFYCRFIEVVAVI